MKNWKIRAKFHAGFSVVIVIGLIFGAAGFVSTRMLTDIAHALSALQEKSLEIEALGNSLIIAIAALVVVSLSAGALLAIYIAGLIAKPCVPFTAYPRKAGTLEDLTLSSGDTRQIGEYGERKDEIGQMITAFTTFLGRLSEIQGILAGVPDGDLTANSIEKANRGVQIAHETAESFSEIVSGINESSLLAGDIATASEEQSACLNRINIGIGRSAQAVRQNSATARESAASQEMSGQSATPQELIAQFKLDDDTVAARIVAHSRKRLLPSPK